MSKNQQQNPITAKEILKSLKETSKMHDKLLKKMNKTDEQMKKTDEQINKTDEQIEKIIQQMNKTDEQMRKTDEQMKKTDEQMKKTDERMRKTDEQMNKTDEQMKKTDHRISKVGRRFDDKWGMMVESMVEGKVVELLQSRGIDVHETGSRIKRAYTDEKGELQAREIDIIAANGKEVVAVEVKTTLKPDDVKYFMETLKAFKRFFSAYKNKIIYGAVAYLRSDAEAPVFAERQGLFVIRATGDSASIINKKNFKPKAF